jgi:hypothetical protein
VALRPGVDLGGATRIGRDVTDDVGTATPLVEVRLELLGDRARWEGGGLSQEAQVLDVHAAREHRHGVR